LGNHDTTKIPMDMEYLQLAARATGGMYIPGSTPQTIVNTFKDLFRGIVDTTFIGLPSLTFTNQNTGERRTLTYQMDTAYPKGGHYKAAAPPCNLAFGTNTFIFTWAMRDTAGVQGATRDTITIIRKTTSGTATNKDFKTESGVDTVGLSIRCSQGTAAVGGFDTVTIATANATDTGIFKPKNIIVRAFVPFPDDGDSGTLALFHLDSNVVNSVPNGASASGTLQYSSDAAFGNAVSGGLFFITWGPDIQGDFTFECWIKPCSPELNGILFDNENFDVLLQNGYLLAHVKGAIMKTPNVIDVNVWQHVAVARRDGTANIFINGMPRTAGMSAPGPIIGGGHISVFKKILLDEVRVSTVVRTSEIQGTTVLQIPCAENLQWKINNATTALSSAILPADVWQRAGGSAKVQVTSLVPATVIVNFLDMLSSPSFIWSVNSEPITFGTGGSPVRRMAQIRAGAFDPDVKVFDVRGKLLKKGIKSMLRSGVLNLKGIYFLKYQNGKIERRMTMSKFGNNGR
jgi:hypothetical protein